MASKALFSGLVVDEEDEFVETILVGPEAFYVVDDDGFLRHIESESVDREVLLRLFALMEGHEDLLTEHAAKMIGQEDLFTRAAIEHSLGNLEAQVDQLLQLGLPEDTRIWLGMMGFQVRINFHGEVVGITQPGIADPDEEL